MVEKEGKGGGREIPNGKEKQRARAVTNMRNASGGGRGVTASGHERSLRAICLRLGPDEMCTRSDRDTAGSCVRYGAKENLYIMRDHGPRCAKSPRKNITGLTSLGVDGPQRYGGLDHEQGYITNDVSLHQCNKLTVILGVSRTRIGNWNPYPTALASMLASSPSC